MVMVVSIDNLSYHGHDVPLAPSGGKMAYDPTRHFAPVVEHEALTWNSLSRVAWLDDRSLLPHIYKLFREAGYSYCAWRREGDLMYVFSFVRSEPLSYERLKPGEIELCFRLLKPTSGFLNEVVYRFASTSAWNVFTAASWGENSHSVALCAEVHEGAEVTIRPCIG